MGRKGNTAQIETKEERTVGYFDNSGVPISAISGILEFLKINRIPCKPYEEIPSLPYAKVESIFLINPSPNSEFSKIKSCISNHPGTEFYMITPFSSMRAFVKEKVGEFGNLEYITTRDTDRLAEILLGGGR